MCGIAFTTGPIPLPTLSIEHRGPDGLTTGSNHLGTWCHALMTTQGSPRHTIETPYGVCLYNGDVYNWPMEDNDYNSIVNRTTDNPSELIAHLRGEFAVVFVHESAVHFAVDPWRTRALWYYHDSDLLAVASLPDVLRQHYGTAYKVRPNHHYTWDRSTHKLTWKQIQHFDLTQKTDNYDLVFEKLEQAVQDRVTDNSLTMMSSGMDCGVILAASRSLGLDPRTVTVPWGERNDILAERLKLHRSHIVKFPKTSTLIAEIERQIEMHWSRYSKNEDTIGTIAVIKELMWRKKTPRVLINGIGGDEMYSDYGILGQPMRWESNFGGLFPEDLAHVWPWHNRIHDWTDRDDLIAGFYGVATRYPLLDRELVQAWLNTTYRLKNRSYKDWLRCYIEEKKYPFTDVKTGFAQWRRDTVEHSRPLPNYLSDKRAERPMSPFMDRQSARSIRLNDVSDREN